MESLRDIMTQKNLDEPTEIVALKRFCVESFSFTPKISIRNDVLWLSVPNGIIATELRMQQKIIVNRCGITHKLRIRIG